MKHVEPIARQENKWGGTELIKLAPQLVQYQGSKRKLAPQIIPYMPESIDRLVEPFSGMAAITVAVATKGMAKRYWINDVNEPLIQLLKTAVEKPDYLYECYKAVWDAQFVYPGGHIEHYYYIRELFNTGEKTPANTLYLLARCVKGAVRYSSEGNFNQSPDKRRHGTRPERVKGNAMTLHELLCGKTLFTSLDFRELIGELSASDFIYMDPPYQGVSNTRDHRYYSGVAKSELIDYLEKLNDLGCDYILSYDGKLGVKAYGDELPSKLGCKKIMLDAGLSAQSTLLGKKETTIEALYLSRGLFCD